jgi:hypothetical protein
LVALAFAAVCAGTHPVQEELVALLDAMEEAQWRLDLRPGALQSVLIKRRAVGHDHLGGESATFAGLEKRVHGLLVIGLDQLEGDRNVPQGGSGKQNRATAGMDFGKAQHA